MLRNKIFVMRLVCLCLALAACDTTPFVPGPSVPGYPKSGAYGGRGVVTYSAGGSCRDFGTRQFYVDGTQVLFGRFVAEISPQWNFLSTYGTTYLEGKFTGTHMQGALVQGPQSCTYMMDLDLIPGTSAD